MCGICGIINHNFQFDQRRDIVQLMNSVMSHRGPDNSGIWCDDTAVLGHVRLSILDLTKNGHQPMRSFDGRYIISFNGEVYNYKEIREQLINIGISFNSNSDTEVIVNGWATWGEHVVEKLNGIFAFSIWDHETETLFLVRDRFGTKPIFYYMDGKKMVFSSEIKPITKTHHVVPNMSFQALHEYSYFGSSHGENTLFASIKRVRPGEIIKYQNEKVTFKKYWKIEDIAEVSESESTILGKVASFTELAVKRQLISDVPVGIFLSGGVDSSVITAYASKHYNGVLNTYSARFDFEGSTNELPMAKYVSNHFGTCHHELIIKGIDLPNIIDDLANHHGVPFGDAANIPLYLISKELNGSPKVMLQGDGGDELFGGYRSYKLLKNYTWWKLLSHFSLLTNNRTSSGFMRRLDRLLEAFSNDDRHLILAYLSTTDTKNVSLFNLFSRDIQQQMIGTDPFNHFRESIVQFSGRDIVHQMLCIDMETQLPNVFLEKVDRATMAFGIESRVPFLDNELAEYAISIPSKFKVKGNTGKLILKDAMRGVVPDKVLDARKIGFGVPYGEWLATSLYSYAYDIFTAEVSSSNSVFAKDKLFSMLTVHRVNPNVQTGYILWKALNFAIWKHKLNE